MGVRVGPGRAARRVVVFNGDDAARDWPVDLVGETSSDAVVMAEVFAGSDVMQAMDQTNPASSRAIAVTTTCLSLPLAIM